MNKVVVIYSGGMDSYTLLNWAVEQGHEVFALSFDYGQRHRKELEYAHAVTRKLGMPHQIFSFPSFGGSSQTDQTIPVPEGRFDEPVMKQTVVPNRNMIMLALATGYAVTVGAEEVWFGAHAGDHAIYPDCREEFIAALDKVTQIANYQPVRIRAPFLRKDKGDIALLGKAMRLDYSKTWTCYKGEEHPCGKCGACVERAEAMAKAGIEEAA